MQSKLASDFHIGDCIAFRPNAIILHVAIAQGRTRTTLRDASGREQTIPNDQILYAADYQVFAEDELTYARMPK